MTVKKINGICSWLLILTFLGHIGTMSYSMLTGWYNYNICKNLAHLTAIITALHVVISLLILFFLTDGSDVKSYAMLNIKTIIQRASGLVVVALLHLHVKAFGFIASGEALSNGSKAVLLITEIAFFGAVFLHIAVSFGKSLITFGLIRTDSSEKLTDRIIFTICAFFFVLTTASLVLFIFKWTGFQG